MDTQVDHTLEERAHLSLNISSGDTKNMLSMTTATARSGFKWLLGNLSSFTVLKEK